MNKRTTEILLEILKNENGSIFSLLTEKFGVSQRTIRNDVAQINSFLSSSGLPELVVSPDGRINYTGDKNRDIEIILKNETDFYTYKLDKDERRAIISLLLLNSPGYITIAAIADEILISRQTIINDLDDVKRGFAAFGLKVISSSNRGLKVAGGEAEKRNMELSIIYSNIYSEQVSLLVANPFSSLMLQTIFNKDDKEIFERIIKAAERKNGLYFTDVSYIHTLYYTMVVIKRMSGGNYCSASYGDVPKNSKYALAEEILSYLCDYFKIECADGEIALFSKMLSSQRYIRNETQNNGDNLKTQMIATRFISAVSEDLAINLNTDFLFYENLVTHLETTLVQEFSEANRNPVLDILTQSYPEIFTIAGKHLDIFSEFMGRDMNEHELSYVVMHICAALERKKNAETPARVMVVCGGGIGTSQLLVERLKRRFKFDILDVTSVHNISKNMLEHVDLIISTVPLGDIEKESVVITPILDDSDYLKIQKKLKALNLTEGEPKTASSLRMLLNEFNKILEKYLDESNRTQAMSEMEDAAKAITGKLNSASTGIALSELLVSSNILLGENCSNYIEAIQAGGRLLLNSGCIEPRYIDAMIANAEQNGPYFIISPGFAVPHAAIEEGVNKIGMSLIRLKEPIIFLNEDVGRVEFVCCLCTTDTVGHTRALFDLINMLDENDFKNELRLAETPEQAASIIKKYECRLCESAAI